MLISSANLITLLLVSALALPTLVGCSGSPGRSAKDGYKIVEFVGNNDGFEVPVSWTSSPGESATGHSVDVVITAPNSGQIEAHTVEQLELKDFLSMQHLSQPSPVGKTEVQIDGVNFKKETSKGKDEAGSDAVMSVYSRATPSANATDYVFVCRARDRSALEELEKGAESYKF